jgi:uncharacterized protein with GYD domain
VGAPQSIGSKARTHPIGQTDGRAIAALAESVGGQLESFYFAFGERDVYTVVDLPDNESATAVALTVNA